MQWMKIDTVLYATCLCLQQIAQIKSKDDSIKKLQLLMLENINSWDKTVIDMI